jgi:hypothetical protein
MSSNEFFVELDDGSEVKIASFGERGLSIEQFDMDKDTAIHFTYWLVDKTIENYEKNNGRK